MTASVSKVNCSMHLITLGNACLTHAGTLGEAQGAITACSALNACCSQWTGLNIHEWHLNMVYNLYPRRQSI